MYKQNDEQTLMHKIVTLGEHETKSLHLCQIITKIIQFYAVLQVETWLIKVIEGKLSREKNNLYVIDDAMYEVVFVSWPLIGISLFIFIHNEKEY